MENKAVKIDLKAARRNRSREVVRRFKKNKLAMIGLVIILCMILLAVFADVIADYDEGAHKDALRPASAFSFR